MPIDWDQFESELDSMIAKSADMADDMMARMISSVTRLTHEEVKNLFPSHGEIAQLTRLIKVVKSRGARNTKIKSIIENSEEFSGPILTLLEKLV